MGETTSNEAPAVLTALRNELVLEKIFQFLPMKSLLPCSDVCKIWNKQSRMCIRDHRKWTISICPPFACNHLNELDETIGKMTVVPFNSLDFYLEPHENCLFHQNAGHQPEQPHDEASDGRFSFENLFTRMKLRYLSICVEGEFPNCPAIVTISRLLLEKGNEIKELQLGRITFSLAQRFREINELEMPLLQKLQLTQFYDYCGKEFIGKILHGSNPKLTKIMYSGDNRILAIIPDSKLKFLGNFSLKYFNDEIMDRIMKLAESRPTLTELNARFSLGHYHEIPQQCLQLVQSLLNSSSNSLRKLNLTPICCLKSMSFPPLESVISLKIGSCRESDEMRSFLHLIEFGRLFPKSQNVEMSLRDYECDLFGGRPLEFENEWVQDHQWDPQNSSRTTSVLALKGSIRSFSFLQLQKSFPAVVDLLLMPPANTSRR